MASLDVVQEATLVECLNKAIPSQVENIFPTQGLLHHLAHSTILKRLVQLETYEVGNILLSKANDGLLAMDGQITIIVKGYQHPPEGMCLFTCSDLNRPILINRPH